MSILFTLVTQVMKKLPHEKTSTDVASPESTKDTSEAKTGAAAQQAILDEAADTPASATPDEHQK